MNTHAKAAIEILMMLVTVVITSAVILLLINAGILKVKAQGDAVDVLNTEFIPLGRGGTLVLKDFKFCEFVDTKFRCFNEKNIFARGDNVYVVFLVEVSPFNGDVILSRNYRLTNPLNEIILDVEQKNRYEFTLTSTKETESIAFADYFTTTSDYQEGEYTLHVVIENPLINKKITASKKFVVE